MVPNEHTRASESCPVKCVKMDAWHKSFLPQQMRTLLQGTLQSSTLSQAPAPASLTAALPEKACDGFELRLMRALSTL